MSQELNTQQILAKWERAAERSRHDTRPMAPDYIVLTCKVPGCDSHQLNDVFSTKETLNCKYVTSTGIRNGKADFVCDKHDVH